MAQRSSSRMMAACIAVVAWALAGLATAPATFVAPPRAAPVQEPSMRLDPAAQAAVVGAVLAMPQAAHAGQQGYALLQLGWAVFLIGLGPAVLFWIYFNKPEIL